MVIMDKRIARQRRSKRTRHQIKRLAVPRLCVHRTLQHIYVQVIAATGDTVLVSASTNEKSFREKHKATSNSDAAAAVGTLIAARAKKAKILKVAFDRSGFKYHGRIKALADAAREGGLEF